MVHGSEAARSVGTMVASAYHIRYHGVGVKMIAVLIKLLRAPQRLERRVMRNSVLWDGH